jgi:cyclic-di-GMP phosphodiesterase, flagellum assembly factor TipF
VFKGDRVSMVLAAASGLAVFGLLVSALSNAMIWTYVGAGLLASGLLGLAYGVHLSSQRALLASGAVIAVKNHLATLARLVRENGERLTALGTGAGVPSASKQAAKADETADMEALSKIVADLAETVRTQEEMLVALSARIEASEPRVTAPRRSAQIANAMIGLRLSGEDTVEGAIPAAHPEKEQAAVEPPAPPPVSPVDPVLANRVRSALQTGRYDVYLRPVVVLPQRKTRFFEATIGVVHEGVTLSGETLNHIVRRSGAARQRDIAGLARLVKMVRYFLSRDRKSPILLALADSETLSDKVFANLVEIMRADSAVANLIMIGLPQTAVTMLRPVQQEVLRTFREAGGKLIMTDVVDLSIKPEALASSGIRLVQAPFHALSHAIEEGVAIQDVHAQDLPGLFRRRGVEMLISDIATEQDLNDLGEAELTLAEGNLFGDWRLVQDDLLVAPPAAAMQDNGPPAALPAAESPTPPVEPEVARASFRSLLRRA